jgi:hypothetical protein
VILHQATAAPQVTATEGPPRAPFEPSRGTPLSPSGTIRPEPPQPPPNSRPRLAANLSLADLARVRQALALLSDDPPETAAGATAGRSGGSVPDSEVPGQQSEPPELVLPDGPVPAAPADVLPPAAAAKLDQIKDLLLTAEAIGEHNLDQHFEQVRQRQRELIREFFDEAGTGRDDKT